MYETKLEVLSRGFVGIILTLFLFYFRATGVSEKVICQSIILNVYFYFVKLAAHVILAIFKRE